MSATYTYEMRLFDESKDISALLEERGLLQKRGKEDTFSFLSEEMGGEPVLLKKDGSTLFYQDGIAPDTKVCDNLSKALPEEVMEVIRFFDGYPDSLTYQKGGELCNKEGEEISALVPMLHPYLVKQVGDGTYRCRFNLGQKGWRTIFFEEKDIEPLCIVTNGMVDTIGYLVMFRGSEVDTYRTTVWNLSENDENRESMTVRDFFSAYHGAREQYLQRKFSPAKIENLESSAFRKKKDPAEQVYYLVDIPVPESFARNGRITVAAGEKDVNLSEGSLVLGVKGRARRVTMLSENGKRTQVFLSNEEIASLNERANIRPKVGFSTPLDYVGYEEDEEDMYR